MGVAHWGGNNVVNFCAWVSACSSPPLTIENAAGNNFDLLAFDFATGGIATPTSLFFVTGILATGGTVQSTIVSPPEIYSDGTGVMATYAFDSNWTDLSRVEISWPTEIVALGSIDNVSLQAIPIPAAVWLFGSGLGLLGWFRKRSV